MAACKNRIVNLGSLEPVTRMRRWVRTRGRDADAHAALASRHLPLPPGLTIQWLGTAGYRLDYEGQTLLIDPYLSRVSMRDVVTRAPARPNPARLDEFLGDVTAVAGVLVGHTHFDHAVDAPEIARRFGCSAYGSESLRRLMTLHGLGDQAKVVTPHQRYDLGPFVVSFTPSRHSKLIAGLVVPSDGELTCEHLDGLSSSAYRCGQVWGIRIEVAGITIYHQGSADVVEEELTDGPVDVLLAGIAGRYASPGYFETIIRRLSPGIIVPGHYDNFFEPLGTPIEFSLNVNLEAFVEEIERISRNVELVGLPVVGGASSTDGTGSMFMHKRA